MGDIQQKAKSLKQKLASAKRHINEEKEKHKQEVARYMRVIESEQRKVQKLERDKMELAEGVRDQRLVEEKEKANAAEQLALEREIQNLKARNRLLQEQRISMSKELKKAQRLSESMLPGADQMEELKELQSQNLKLKVEKTRLQESNQKLHTKIELILERQQKLQQVSFNSERSMRSLAEKEKRISTLQTRIDLLVLENERLMQETVEKENLQDEVQKLQTEKATLVEHSKKLQKDLELSNLSRNEAMKELKVKESKVVQLTKEVGDIKFSAARALQAKNFDKEKALFEQLKRELEERIRMLDNDLKNSNRELK